MDADGPALVRNYDLDPALNEGRLFASAWLGREVVGMVDGLAGLADGMNAAGLAVSLAFGGRPVVGRGFGVPLIVRYLLEVCADVPDAVEALRGLPCHMAYNLTLIDRRGAHATVLLAPDRPADRDRGAVRHQPPARRRVAAARAAVADARARGLPRAGAAGPGAGLRGAAPRCSSRRRCTAAAMRLGFGTVYTAVYRPVEGRMQYRLARASRRGTRASAAFTEGARRIAYPDGEAPREGPAAARAARRHPSRRAPARSGALKGSPP